jgi:uncharacterized protein (DUF983 family)
MIEMSTDAPAAPASSTPDQIGTLIVVRRGLLCRCPACGEGRLFGRYLKVAPSCEACGLEFHHHRADDFPPYIVMFIVGHLIGYGIYIAETRFEDVPMWLHVALWPAAAIVLCLLLLQPVKGAVVGLQYALGMHGFAGMARRRAEAVAAGTGEDGFERRAWRGVEDKVRDGRA